MVRSLVADCSDWKCARHAPTPLAHPGAAHNGALCFHDLPAVPDVKQKRTTMAERTSPRLWGMNQPIRDRRKMQRASTRSWRPVPTQAAKRLACLSKEARVCHVTHDS